MKLVTGLYTMILSCTDRGIPTNMNIWFQTSLH